MPFTCRIVPDQRLAAIRFEGRVTGAEIVEGIGALFDSPDWSPGFQVIWDGRAITALILDPDAAEDVVAESVARRDRSGQSRTAVLSAGFAVYTSAMVLHLKANRRSGREMQIFERLDDALTWLERDELPPPLEALLNE